MKPKVRPPTQSAIARAIGVVPSRIVVLRTMGMPCTSIEAAAEWYAQNIRPMPNRRPREGSDADAPDATHQHRRAHRAADLSAFLQARAAREVYEARFAQLRYEQEVGKLVAADVVRADLARRVIGFRNHVLRLPMSLAPMLLDVDLDRARSVLTHAIGQALAELDEPPGRPR